MCFIKKKLQVASCKLQVEEAGSSETETRRVEIIVALSPLVENGF